MSASPEVSEQDLFYNKILEDLKNLELKQKDSSEETSVATELTQLRRSVCGCSINRTDDVKIEIEKEEAPASVDSSATTYNNEMTKKFCTDLNTEGTSIDTVANIAKLIAELSKDDECRKSLVDQNMFPALNKAISHPNLNDLARTQLFRAIGNLCYYNDKARMDMLACGLTDLFGQFTYCTTLDFTNSSDEEKKAKHTLITVGIGCLHNLTNENETLRTAVYSLGVMSLLSGYIPFLKNSSILVHYTSCLENLLESDEGKEKFVAEKLALKLYEFMDAEFLTGLDENTEDFFNTLNFINDLKMSKTFLCQTNFLSTVISVMETSVNNSDDLLRMLSMFLVGLIVKEENPEEIFAYKNGLVLNRAIEWISNFKNEQLYIASAVIIANYLRNDDSVQSILKDPREPHVKLLQLLKSHYTEQNPTLQQINLTHSLLGALRNFCVLASTRDEILKHGIIAHVLPFIEYENLDVKAKVLSIIRLLVKSCTDKTGLDLIFEDKNLKTLEKIVSDDSMDHHTVIGESSRLVCYLPIAAKSEKNISKMAKVKLAAVIVKQLKTEHLIMLNEALLALNVLVTISYGDFRDQLKELPMNENLKDLFSKEAMPIEMRLNALKLFKFLVDKNDFFSEEQLKEHLTELKKLKTANNSHVILNSCLTQLIDQLENFVA